MGRAEGGSECREVFRAYFQNGERSDTGGPDIPKNLQHSSGRSVKGSTPVSLSSPGGKAWVQMGGRRSQHLLVCRWRENSGAQSDMGADITDDHSKNVWKGIHTDKYEQDQFKGVHVGIHLGPAGSWGLQAESYWRGHTFFERKRTRVSWEECGDNVCGLPSVPHGDVTWYINTSD